MNSYRILMSFALALLVSACGNKYPSNSTASVTETVTYTNQIKKILDGNCIQCHASYLTGAARQGADPADNYDTYEDAASDADAENQSIQSNKMPESGPLSDSDKALFQAWVDQDEKE